MAERGTLPLFSSIDDDRAQRRIADGAWFLPKFALAESGLMAEIDRVANLSPFRHMVTPGGFQMSVEMTNCGAFGWTSDRRGYRYATEDPARGVPWPPMPDAFGRLAVSAAEAAGFHGFRPDACLINRYAPRAKMTLHQDKNERDLSAPIVSVSLGLPATFLFGGMERSDKAMRVPVEHGDVIVWGGPARLRFHGVLPVKDGAHPEAGKFRLNLTFRKVRP